MTSLRSVLKTQQSSQTDGITQTIMQLTIFSCRSKTAKPFTTSILSIMQVLPLEVLWWSWCPAAGWRWGSLGGGRSWATVGSLGWGQRFAAALPACPAGASSSRTGDNWPGTPSHPAIIQRTRLPGKHWQPQLHARIQSKEHPVTLQTSRAPGYLATSSSHSPFKEYRASSYAANIQSNR